MKLNRIITLGVMTVILALGASTLLAQNGGGGFGGGGPGGGGFGGGGPGGGGGFGGGGGRNRGGNGGGFGGQNGGNFDPAQMQQQMMQRQLDNVRQTLDYTNDTEWDAVAPLVQKVLDAQTALRAGQGRGMFGGGRNGGGRNGGGRGGMTTQVSTEQQALQDALDQGAPAAQIKDLLAKYKASQKAKQTKLEAAQADLKAVLTTRQEAAAVLMGLVD